MTKPDVLVMPSGRAPGKNSARTIRFEFRLSYEESKTLNRIAAKLGETDASKALRRLMQMYEAGELAIDAVMVALRRFEAEKMESAK
jgi:TPR repeat protein